MLLVIPEVLFLQLILVQGSTMEMLIILLKKDMNMVTRQMIKYKVNLTDHDYEIPKDGAHRKITLEIDLQMKKHLMRVLI